MAKRFNLFLIIFFHCTFREINAFRDVISNGVRTILAQEDEKIRVTCEIDSPLSYCGFIHPEGKRFSFSGQELNMGVCSHEIRIRKEDDGIWLCHMGKQPIGLEITQRINVRVVGHLAAVQPTILTLHGESVVLACTTTQKKIALKYCRFEPPVGEAFSINSNVDSKSALLDRYYFPNEMSLDRGDCAVVIKKVKYEDVGVWTCGAAWDDGKEYFDQITIEVQGLYTMSTASVAGTALGAIIAGIALVLLLLVTWKKRHMIGYARRTRQRNTPPRNNPPIELQERAPSRTPQRSPTGSRSTRHIPLVTVQSPSEPGTSPLVA